MDSLERLNFTLKTSAYLLDSAAGQIRDAALSPTKENIHKIGEALVAIYEIQQAIYKIKPELEAKYDEPSQEVSEANQRLGKALISAYELAECMRRHNSMNCLQTKRMALQLSKRKLAMVLKSGASRLVSHISST